jgi:cobalt/nickel transport system permease protein
MNLNLLWLVPPLLILITGGVVKGVRARRAPHSHDGIKGFGHKHGEATLSIDIYAYKSGISNWNPGFKVGLSIGLLLLCVCADNLYLSAIIIFMTTMVTVVLGGMPFHHYVDLMTIPLVFMITGSIVILINFAAGPVDGALVCWNCNWFYVFITQNGVMSTLHLWGKAFGAISAMYMLSLSTMSNEIFSVLRKVHVPKLIIELMHMMYRSIFIMMDTQSRMKNAAQSRLGYRDFKTSIKSFGNSAGNLLIVSMKRGSQLYDAMEARCYDGDLVFLEKDKPVTRNQWIIAGCALCYLAAVWIMTTEGAIIHV